jgi:5,10-methylene-tetrahydrofolate dehydrogenase/Methenyl tetrahydrofolate cyclohydrolase
MVILDGQELADFMKERQGKQVRVLRQAHGIMPKLLILRDSNNPVIDVYVKKKIAYGADILIDVEDRIVSTSELKSEIQVANKDVNISGMILQLPILEKDLTDDITAEISPEKDVDGLGLGKKMDSATAMAINWLLAGYDVDLDGKKIAIIGYGKLVGRPLEKMWLGSGYDVTVFRSKDNNDLARELPKYDVIVTATGKAGLITSDMVKPGAVVVDAGTTSEHGSIKGDVSEELRARGDVSITPKVGGVGPLTITALFDNVIRAASNSKS